MSKEYKCPCQIVDPDNFLTNEEVLKLLENQDNFKFKQEDYFKIYNCVHCRECGTSDERILLKQKFLNDGNQIDGLNDMISIFKIYGTPYKNNRSRIKIPKEISKNSKILLYFGCFTSVKAPKYGEHAIKYLLKNNIEFCTLDKEICCGYPILVTGDIDTYNYLIEKNKQIFQSKGISKIITICPSCYMVFKEHYSDFIEVEYFTAYLKPNINKKLGSVSIQHACPLIYDKLIGVDKKIEELLEKSGYEINRIPYFCCGGGVGHQLRFDIAEKIAKMRVKDFKGDYTTYYCPDCYWFINFYGKKLKIKPKLRDIFELLI